jgi:hypothetical protein
MPFDPKRVLWQSVAMPGLEKVSKRLGQLASDVGAKAQQAGEGIAGAMEEHASVGRLRKQWLRAKRELPEAALRGADRVLRPARQVAEQVGQWLAKGHQSPIRPLINATGIAYDDGRIGGPLPAKLQVAFGVHASGLAIDQHDAIVRFRARMGEMLGVADAVVTERLGAALVALSSAAATAAQPILIPRADVQPVDDRLVTDWLGRGGAKIIEFGAARHGCGDDLRHVVATLRAPATLVRVWGRHAPAAAGFEDAIADCRAHHLLQVVHVTERDVLGQGTQQTSSENQSQRYTGVSASGLVDAWMIASDGCIAGPQAGWVGGSTSFIQRLRETSLWPVLEARPLDIALASEVIDGIAKQGPTAMPLQGLAAVSVENLRHRAEQMKTQIVGYRHLSEAQVSDAAARWWADGDRSIPSIQLRLKLAQGSSQEVAKRLARGEWSTDSGRPASSAEASVEMRPSSVLVGTDGEQTLVIDLRWLPADADRMVIEALSALESPMA